MHASGCAIANERVRESWINCSGKLKRIIREPVSPMNARLIAARELFTSHRRDLAILTLHRRCGDAASQYRIEMHARSIRLGAGLAS